MLHKTVETDKPKGWYVGPWNSDIPIPIGYANEGINEKHYHAQMTEVYLIAKGTSVAVVDEVAISLQAGDILIVEPGEIHTFSASSEDYLHFVLQTLFVRGDKELVE